MTCGSVKRIIPIVLRDVDPKLTHENIRKLNWTFIREGDNFEEGLAKVFLDAGFDAGTLTPR